MIDDSCLGRFVLYKFMDCKYYVGSVIEETVGQIVVRLARRHSTSDKIITFVWPDQEDVVIVDCDLMNLSATYLIQFHLEEDCPFTTKRSFLISSLQVTSNRLTVKEDILNRFAVIVHATFSVAMRVVEIYSSMCLFITDSFNMFQTEVFIT